MNKKDLDRLKQQILADRQRLLDSVSEEKRLELERLAEVDLPPFMRDKKTKRNGKVFPPNLDRGEVSA